MAGATVEVLMTKEVPVDEEVDEEALAAALQTNVTTAAIQAIEESDSGVIDQTTVPVVEVSNVEVIEVSTAPSRGTPKFRLMQLRRKLGDVFDNFFAENWPGWSAKMQRFTQKRVDLMELDYDKKVAKCGEFSPEVEQRADDDGR